MTTDEPPPRTGDYHRRPSPDGRFVDFICPRRWADEMAAELPDVHLLLLGGSGHFGSIEQQDEFVSAVVDFLYDCT